MSTDKDFFQLINKFKKTTTGRKTKEEKLGFKGYKAATHKIIFPAECRDKKHKRKGPKFQM
jgi:hypothetical protein